MAIVDRRTPVNIQTTITARSDRRPWECTHCWKVAEEAISVVCVLTATWTVQQLEALATRYPALGTYEQDMMRGGREGMPCQVIAESCKDWVEAWGTAIEMDQTHSKETREL